MECAEMSSSSARRKKALKTWSSSLCPPRRSAAEIRSDQSGGPGRGPTGSATRKTRGRLSMRTFPFKGSPDS
eukprot:7498338-Pyramimonas_sp.AAC.1